MQVIYIDLLFLVNFALDYILLALTALLRGYYAPMRSLLLGAVVGGCSAIPLFFVPWRMVTVFLSIGVCGSMIRTAFGRQGWRRFGGDCAMLWVLAMALSGGMLLLGQHTGVVRGTAGAIYVEISIGVLVIGTGLAYGLLTLCCRPASFHPERSVRQITCRMGTQKITFRAYTDSGNLMRDSSGRKVILLSPSLVRQLGIAEQADFRNAEGLFLALADTGKAGLLPCQTAGGHGLMVTLRPDLLIVDGEVREDCVFGLAAEEISCVCGCRALIGC